MIMAKRRIIRKRAKTKRIIRPARSTPTIWGKLVSKLTEGSDGSRISAGMDIAKHLNIDGNITDYKIVCAIMSRFDAKVETLQFNHGHHEAFIVTLIYNDANNRKHGVPSRIGAVRTGPRLDVTLMLAYLDLCQRKGEFL